MTRAQYTIAQSQCTAVLLQSRTRIQCPAPGLSKDRHAATSERLSSMVRAIRKTRRKRAASLAWSSSPPMPKTQDAMVRVFQARVHAPLQPNLVT